MYRVDDREKGETMGCLHVRAHGFGAVDEIRANPETMSGLTQLEFGCVIGKHYPDPIVDHKTAYKMASDRVWEVRKTPAAKAEEKRVYEKHGSRKKPRN